MMGGWAFSQGVARKHSRNLEDGIAVHHLVPISACHTVQVTDLMATSARVTLREDKSEGVFIEGLSWHPVACGEAHWWRLSQISGIVGSSCRSLECSLRFQPPCAAGDVLRLLTKGAAYRHTATTKMNDTSSRSHMVRSRQGEKRMMEG